MGRDAKKYLSPQTPARLARFARENHACGAWRLLQKSENDCFAVYKNGLKLIKIDNLIPETLRAALYKYQLSSFGREKMKFLKLSQMNGLDK